MTRYASSAPLPAPAAPGWPYRLRLCPAVRSMCSGTIAVDVRDMRLPTPPAFVSSADASTRAQTATDAGSAALDLMATPTIAKCGCDERAIAAHRRGRVRHGPIHSPATPRSDSREKNRDSVSPERLGTHMTSRVCSGVRGKSCGRIVPASQRRCSECEPQHTVQRNADRRVRYGSREERGYGWHWRQLSVRRRRLHPFCELDLPGCTRLSTETDHHVPIRAGGRATWDNAQAACHACNNAKRRDDLERWPLDRYPEGKAQ